MRTRFILIQTSHAGNVGATARAMKRNSATSPRRTARATGARNSIAQGGDESTRVSTCQAVANACPVTGTCTARPFDPVSRKAPSGFAPISGSPAG